MELEPLSTISSSTEGYCWRKTGSTRGRMDMERRVEMPTRSRPLVSWRISSISR